MRLQHGIHTPVTKLTNVPSSTFCQQQLQRQNPRMRHCYGKVVGMGTSKGAPESNVQLKLYTSSSGVYAVCCKAISESRLALNSSSFVVFVTAIGMVRGKKDCLYAAIFVTVVTDP
jgi:hypothetical protein